MSWHIMDLDPLPADGQACFIWLDKGVTSASRGDSVDGTTHGMTGAFFSSPAALAKVAYLRKTTIKGEFFLLDNFEAVSTNFITHWMPAPMGPFDALPRGSIRCIACRNDMHPVTNNYGEIRCSTCSRHIKQELIILNEGGKVK